MAISKLAISFACIVALAMAGHAVAQSSPDDYVNAHNSARSNVGVGPVAWNDTIAAYTENFANQRVNDCELILSNGPFGENLHKDIDPNYTGVDAVNSWVAEGQYYNYDDNTCVPGKVCAVYTQVVWNTTTDIGCALVVCNNNLGVLVICDYFPSGNIGGRRPY